MLEQYLLHSTKFVKRATSESIGIAFEVGSDVKYLGKNFIVKPISRMLDKLPKSEKEISYFVGKALLALMVCAPMWYSVMSSSERKACYRSGDKNTIDSCIYDLEQENRKRVFDAELILGSAGLFLGGICAIYYSLPKKK